MWTLVKTFIAGLFSNSIVSYAVIAAAVLLGSGVIYYKGYSSGKAHEAADQRAAIIQFEQTIADQKQQLIKLNKPLVIAAEQQRVKSQTVRQTVKANPNITKKFFDDNAKVPAGFVTVHDMAASNKPIESYTFDYNKPGISKFSYPEVSNVLVSNYYTCHEIRQNYISLQGIVKNYQKKQKELVK